MFDITFYVFILTLGLGLLLSYYYRLHRHTWGTLLGIAVAAEGGFFAFAYATSSELSLIILVGAIGLMAVIILTFFTFGRDPRVLLLIGLQLLLLEYRYRVLLIHINSSCRGPFTRGKVNWRRHSA